MSQAVLGASVLPVNEVEVRAGRCRAIPEIVPAQRGWDPERFGREQMLGLIRQVFFSSTPARQVVFSTVDPFTDGGGLCLRAAETLAGETESSIAILDLDCAHDELRNRDGRRPGVRGLGTRIRENIWRVPVANRAAGTAALQTYMTDVRQGFAYSIVNASWLGQSGQAMEVAQAADGIILVVSARRTRRAAAMRMKEMVQASRARLLGVVLSDREFPIPERIYRGL